MADVQPLPPRGRRLLDGAVHDKARGKQPLREELVGVTARLATVVAVAATLPPDARAQVLLDVSLPLAGDRQRVVAVKRHARVFRRRAGNACAGPVNDQFCGADFAGHDNCNQGKEYPLPVKIFLMTDIFIFADISGAPFFLQIFKSYGEEPPPLSCLLYQIRLGDIDVIAQK